MTQNPDRLPSPMPRRDEVGHTPKTQREEEKIVVPVEKKGDPDLTFVVRAGFFW